MKRNHITLQERDLRLRPVILPEDIDIACPWYQDEEVLYYSEGAGNSPYSKETIGRMYRYLEEKGEPYIIEVDLAGEWIPIGDATLSMEMLPIVIGVEDYRGKGYGKRVIRMFIDRAMALGWKNLKVNKIYLYNRRSKRMFESLGFEIKGRGTDEMGRLYENMELDLTKL